MTKSIFLSKQLRRRRLIYHHVFLQKRDYISDLNLKWFESKSKIVSKNLSKYLRKWGKGIQKNVKYQSLDEFIRISNFNVEFGRIRYIRPN